MVADMLAMLLVPWRVFADLYTFTSNFQIKTTVLAYYLWFLLSAPNTLPPCLFFGFYVLSLY